VRKAVIVTLGASGVVVLERVGSGLSANDGPDAGPAADAVAAGGDETAATRGTPASTGAAPASRAASRSAAPRRSDLRVWEVTAEKVATVDSTGAGDAFCGALAAALAEGRPLSEAVQRAVAGGALATTHVGAREGMPTRAELEAFLAARQPA
jgi:sugar/nucleoside kinase (ribokinase family)